MLSTSLSAALSSSSDSPSSPACAEGGPQQRFGYGQPEERDEAIGRNGIGGDQRLERRRRRRAHGVPRGVELRPPEERRQLLLPLPDGRGDVLECTLFDGRAKGLILHDNRVDHLLQPRVDSALLFRRFEWR
jgi:hypothetical protein